MKDALIITAGSLLFVAVCLAPWWVAVGLTLTFIGLGIYGSGVTAGRREAMQVFRTEVPSGGNREEH